jgi:hypothetical protein
MTNGFHHELLDRLYIIMDMWNDYIIEHNSDDVLSKEEKQEVMDILSETYQKVGARIN